MLSPASPVIADPVSGKVIRQCASVLRDHPARNSTGRLSRNSRAFQNRLFGSPVLSTYSSLRDPNPPTNPLYRMHRAQVVAQAIQDTPISRDLSESPSLLFFHK